MITPNNIFIAVTAVIVLSYLFDQLIAYLNRKSAQTEIPTELEGVYDDAKYKKSIEYNNVKSSFGFYSSTFSLIIMLLMLFFDGFKLVHIYTQTIIDHPVWLSLMFFGVLMLGSGVLSLPFELYSIFVIEEKFGFNKTTVKTFVLDKIKGLVVGSILGGVLLFVFVWLYQVFGQSFWLFVWGVFTIVMVLVMMFYASFIVPLFNKLTPMEEGELRTEIESYCKKVGFKLDNLFVMDGSKRSTKANAFFSGLGAKKRIVLYDTLVNEYSKEEITAVLAHEVGHYKKKHTLTSLLFSILQIGLMLFVFSLVVDSQIISSALGVEEKSVHINLLVFSVLYSPLSSVTGVFMNVLSRKNEYEADGYAKETYEASPLISSLKKLSSDSLSNLTPHKLNVFFNYSHPTLLQRVKALNK